VLSLILPSPSSMFYHNKRGKRIDIVNPGRPLNLSAGGMIPALPGTEKHPEEDTISAKLEVGSLVVPVKVVKHLKGYKGDMTGPVTTNPKKLVNAIVMPDEKVIHRKHAPKVEQFLKRKGIKLPLGS
jgi:hypothetical protein